MIARVTLEIALGKEFDYSVPAELADQVNVGTRVQVPLGRRKVYGVVTALADRSERTNLKPIIKIVGTPSLLTPGLLRLARWISEYYCCPLEVCLKTVLPEAVRREQADWRRQLFVRAVPFTGELPRLSKRQLDVLHIVEERRELPLTELLKLAETTTATVRRLEDKGLVAISPQITERDPYAHEQIVPTQPLELNAAQARALQAIKAAMGATGVAPDALDVAELKVLPASCRHEPTANGSAQTCARESGSPFFCKDANVQVHSGWLPHWRQQGKIYFVTFRLADSLAQDDLKALAEQKRIWESHHPKPWSEADWQEYHHRFTERLEKMLDAGYGSCVLRQPEIGAVVEQALRNFDGAHYLLGMFVVMPNHVHVLLQPLGNHSLEGILHSWKSFTAKKINALLGAKGQLWQEEYFDHIVCSPVQYLKFQQYIEENPVKAGIQPGAFRLGAGSLTLPEHCRPEASSTVVHGTSGVSGGETHQLLAGSGQTQSCRQDASSTLKSPVFLLHGVTGSGKTEVYLQAIAHALELGKGAIVLVPEISLTPQTVERFKARFCHGPNRTLVAVLHSHLSAGERHDEWHKIRQGRARIVIGARSAIFAPVHPLGLIIVDEEHEHTYKQEDAPRYHARDVAIVRGQIEGAVVVLGSATPSLESYYNARRGKYNLLELPERVDGRKMPFVRVIDMRQAARSSKGIPIFSGQLKEAIIRRLERGEQTILFLNRRGYSTALECPVCGYVAKCVNCSLALTYHRREQILLCHICGYTAPVPAACPNEKCRSTRIRYAGLGTEKVEETLSKLFPFARIARMDSDIMKRKEDYRRLLSDFRTGKIDVLVGTQMIAKGLHFPNVTLVGIIYADLALHQPDFRAAERTFQLLTQVAGRAGRGDVEGEVFVQAFTPFHPAIQYARRHDYSGFYEQEIEFRQQLRYPPFSRVALLTLKGRNEQKVKLSAEYLRRELDKIPMPVQAKTSNEADAEETELLNENQQSQTTAANAPATNSVQTSVGVTDLIIAGPAPAPVSRAMTYYRYQIMLRTRRMVLLSRCLAKLAETFALPEGVTLTIDIDPVDLL